MADGSYCAGQLNVPPVRRKWILQTAVLAVLGRALAVAPAELLRRVVVTGEVGGLDAPHRARRLRAADLAQLDERCMHVTGGQSRQWHQA